jgi:hypothetical protein
LELETILPADWYGLPVVERFVLQTAEIIGPEAVAPEGAALDIARTFMKDLSITLGRISKELQMIIESTGCQIDEG